MPGSAPRDRRCTCGHGEAAHEHWRPGMECSVLGCPCPAFWRGPMTILRELYRRVVWGR